ncbi:MAG: tetratricopeptide repeat protein [bacterium]|nr:MAG: tetratricopeptide repeat protein [bacterium]
MLIRHSILFISLASLALAGCAPMNPYIKAEGEYYAGDPFTAESTLAPLYEKEAEKDGKMTNLYLWDMGVYRFAQGNYEGAAELFLKSVKDKEAIHDAGETTKAILTSSGDQKYVGDPVEVSVAYLYLGLSYYMLGDYKNAWRAFKRSTEEDLSKEEVRHGDMALTNFLLGECYERLNEPDDAIAAYRRAVESSKGLVPGYIALYAALKKRGREANIPQILEEIEKRVDGEYFEEIKENPDQGIVLVVLSGRPSPVTADDIVGAFRSRTETNCPASCWQMSCDTAATYFNMFLADHMHNHFKDQGGLSDEMRQQATRAVVAEGMKKIPVLGLFAPETKADVRYWPTMHGWSYIGYYPAGEGTHSLRLQAYDYNNNMLSACSKSWDAIPVDEKKRTLVVMTSCGILCKQRE